MSKVSLFLWGAALVVAIVAIGLLGSQVFYGYIIPQAGSASTLPIGGVIVFAFAAGVVSFFSPCPFSVFPAYAAFFLTSKEKKAISRADALHFAAAASAGVITFFIVLGVILTSLGTQLAYYVNYIKLIAIAIIFLFGVVLLTGKSIRTRALDKLTDMLSLKFKNWGAFGYGIIYAIAGAACFLPVILTIALIPILSGDFVVGLAAFITYGLAVSLTLTVATVIIATGRQRVLQSIIGKVETLKRLSGMVLIATALFLLSFYLWTGM